MASMSQAPRVQSPGNIMKSGAADCEKIWELCLSEFEIQSSSLVAKSKWDPYRRTYFHENNIYKFVLTKHETSSSKRYQNLKGEMESLNECMGIQGVPVVKNYYQTPDYEVLIMACFPGETLVGKSLDISECMYILFSLSSILSKVCLRGISHNDVTLDNILYSRERGVCLIDFDQASSCNFVIAFLRSFIGLNVGVGYMNGNFRRVTKELVKKTLPSKTITWIKRKYGNYFDADSHHTLPTLAENANDATKAFLKGWDIAQRSDASSPGVLKAYYSFDIGGYHFPGERCWEDRWEILSKITNYSGKKVLELGCNMGLLSCSLLDEKGCSAVLAVDSDSTILQAAEQIGKGFGVEPNFKRINFDDSGPWEQALLEFKPDIVFALNVLHWVADKKRFICFLSQFSELIFEGHGRLEDEIILFKKMGYKEVQVIDRTERGRHIYHCKK